MFNRNWLFRRSRPERRFRRGVIRYVILDYLKDKPSYGYEVIRALEERSHGLYVPSPGTVYPTLQMLEEMGYVTSAEEDGKRIYTISDEGKRFLAERERLGERIKEHLNLEVPANIDEIRKTMRAFGRLAELLSWEAPKAEREKLGRMCDVITRAYDDIDSIVKS